MYEGLEYCKINTIFKRDKKTNNILPEEGYVQPEFEILKDVKFECTEKIDGTNIRVIFDKQSEDQFDRVVFLGRTDNANIPGHLVEKLTEIFTIEKLREAFKNADGVCTPGVYVLYGEGYGYKIQKGGNYIPDGVNFILFDIKIGKWWLLRDALEDMAKKLDIDIVPLIGYMTVEEAIAFVEKGFKSTIAANKDYNAEGLVLKAPLGMKNRKGDRIMTKIKTVDFEKLKRARK